MTIKLSDEILGLPGKIGQRSGIKLDERTQALASESKTPSPIFYEPDKKNTIKRILGSFIGSAGPQQMTLGATALEQTPKILPAMGYAIPTMRPVSDFASQVMEAVGAQKAISGLSKKIKDFADVSRETLIPKNQTFPEKIVSGLGSAVGFAPLGAAGGLAGKAVGASPAVFGSVVAAIGESELEAQEAEKRAIAKGMTEPEAKTAKTKAFWANFPFIAATNIPGFMGRMLKGQFGKTAKEAAEGMLKSGAKSILPEAGQEFYQSIVGDVAVKDKVNLKDAAEQGLIGGIVGGLFGGAAGLQNKPETIQEFKDIHKLAKKLPQPGLSIKDVSGEGALPEDLKPKDNIVRDEKGDPVTIGQPEEYKPDLSLIDKKVAYWAHQGTSFSPEKRGEQEIANFGTELQSIHDKLKPLAKSPEAQKILFDEMKSLEKTLAAKKNALLRRRTGLASSMIAGPSNFPVERMRKKNAAYDNAVSEYLDFQKRASGAIAKKLNALYTSEQGGEIEVIKKKIANAEKAHDTMRQANKIVRENISDDEKIKKLIPLVGEKNAAELLKPDFAGRKGFAPYQIQSSTAEIKRLKERIATFEERDARTSSELKFDGGSILKNSNIDRIQIFFDAKPSPEVIGKLRSKGFKWSPSNKAWQRQWTKAAEWATQDITGVNLSQKATAPSPEAKPKEAENWKMPLNQFIEARKEGAFPLGIFEAKSIHKADVEQALKEGKPVPPEVLKDYPDLQKKEIDTAGKTAHEIEMERDTPTWKYEDYSKWSRQLAEDYTKSEIEKKLGKAQGDRSKASEAHLKAADEYRRAAQPTEEEFMQHFIGLMEEFKKKSEVKELERMAEVKEPTKPLEGFFEELAKTEKLIMEGDDANFAMYNDNVYLNDKVFPGAKRALLDYAEKNNTDLPTMWEKARKEQENEKNYLKAIAKIKKDVEKLSTDEQGRKKYGKQDRDEAAKAKAFIQKAKEKLAKEGRVITASEAIKQGMSAEEWVKKKLNRQEKIVYLKIGDKNIEVIKNPTDTSLRQLREEYSNDFPEDTGSPTRHSFDSMGNKYVWRSDSGVHSDVEPILNKMFNTKTSQNQHLVFNEDVVKSQLLSEYEAAKAKAFIQKAKEKLAKEGRVITASEAIKQGMSAEEWVASRGKTLYHGTTLENASKQEAPSEEVEYKGEKMSLAKYKKLRKAERLAEEGKMNFIKQPPKEPPKAPPASPEEEGEEGWETPQGKREPGKKMPIEDQADLELFTVEQGQGLHPLENVMKGYKIKLSDKNKADWEGVAKRFIDNKKGIAPDDAASEIYNSNPGLLAEPTEEALKEALLKLGDKPIKYGLSKEVQAYLKSKGAAEEVSKRIEEKYGKKLSEEQIRKIAYSYSGLRRSITPYLDVARIGYQAGKKEGRAVEKKIQMTKREAAIDRLKKAFEWKMDKLASKELEKRAIESAIDRDRLERTKEYYEEVDKAKKAIIEYAIEKLPKEARGKLLVAVRDARTAEAASRAFRKIDDEVRRIERRAVLSEIKALLKYVSNTSAIAVDYKEAINEMAEAVDLVKRKPETLDRLRKTLEYMENAKAKGKDVYMPERVLKQLKILFRKPIDQLSTAELRNMLAEIKDIAEAGAMKQKIKDEQYKIRRERIADELINGTQPIEQKVIRGRIKGDPQSKLTLKDKLCNIVARSFNTLQHIDVSLSFMDVLMDYLDGGKGTFDGANFRGHQMLKSDYTEYLKAKQPFITSILAKLKDLKLNDDNLMRVRYWQDLKQKDGKQYLLESGIPEEFLEKLEKEGLTKEEKELYDHMREIYEEIYPMLKDVMKRVYNKEVGYVQNYANFILDMDNVDDLLLEERFGDYAEYARRKNVNANMTKKRTGKAAPLKLHNAVDRMVAYLDNALYLVHMAEDIRTLQEIVKSPEYKEAAGKVGQSAWVDYLDVAARRGGWNNANKVKALDILRKYASASVMGYKLSVAMLQPSALFDGIMFIGDYAPAGFMDICTNKEMRKFAYDNMPELRDRVGDDRALLDVTDDSFLDKFIQSGYVPMRKLDSITAAGVALGAYKKYLKEHNIAFDINNPNKEAIRYAQDIMNRSQSSANFLDIPLALSRGKLTGNLSVDRAILQFQSFILREYNNIDKLALRAYMRGGRGGGDKDIKKGVSMIFWLLIATAFAEIARRGSSALVGQLFGRREYDFKDEYFSGMARELASKIPFVGNQMSVALYNGGIVPSVRILEAPVTGATRMIAGKKPETKAKGALEMVSVMPGGVQIADIGKRVIERLSGSEAKSAALRQFEEYIKGGMKDEELYKEARRNAIKAQVLVKDVKTNALKNVKKEVKDKIEAGILADNENVIREGIRLGRKYGFDKEELAGMMEDVENRIEKREEKKKKIKLQLE